MSRRQSRSPTLPVPTAFVKEQDLSQVWRIGSSVVMMVAVLLRVAWLTLKPFHHDEGVNGFF
ncbi:MAG: hypothetical protein WKF71_06080 [Pyrinomonadaceae bacterium]